LANHKLTDQISIKISQKTAPILLRSYRYLLPYWKISGGAYLALVGESILNIGIPQILRYIIDTGIRQGQTKALIWASLSLLGLTLLRGGLTFLEGRWSEIASQNVAYDLRNDLQRKLTILSFSFHDRTETGDLLSRAVQDVDRIRFLTGRATLRIFEAIFLLVGTSLALLWMNARLASIVLLFVPFLVLAALEFGRRYRPLSQQIQKQLGALTTTVEQNLRGAQLVKIYAQESTEIQRFEKENESWFNLSARANRLQAFNLPLLFLLANLGVVLIVW
jgi:ATP-binding cassette subfamily B protein